MTFIDTLLGSASQLHRTLNCPASRWLPQSEPTANMVKSRRRGKLIHKYLELVGDNVSLGATPSEARDDVLNALDCTPAERAELLAIPLQSISGLTRGAQREVAFSLRGQDGRVLHVEDRAYHEELENEEETPGTVDVVIPGFRHVEVYDYKTGRVPVKVEHNAQLVHLATCAVLALAPHATHVTVGVQTIKHLKSGCKVETSTAMLDRWAMQKHALRVRKAQEVARTVRQAAQNGQTPPVNRGKWCRFCPAKDACPAWQEK